MCGWSMSKGTRGHVRDMSGQMSRGVGGQTGTCVYRHVPLSLPCPCLVAWVNAAVLQLDLERLEVVHAAGRDLQAPGRTSAHLMIQASVYVRLAHLISGQ